MPVLKSSKKALRVSKRRKGENDLLRKKIRAALYALRTTPNKTSVSSVYSALDKATRKNIFHKNKAARLKSQVSKLISSSKTKAN